MYIVKVYNHYMYMGRAHFISWAIGTKWVSFVGVLPMQRL